jgi:hypothetical protein
MTVFAMKYGPLNKWNNFEQLLPMTAWTTSVTIRPTKLNLLVVEIFVQPRIN